MNVKLQPLISVFESPCLADSGSCSLCKEMLICCVFLIDSLILQLLTFTQSCRGVDTAALTDKCGEADFIFCTSCQEKLLSHVCLQSISQFFTHMHQQRVILITPQLQHIVDRPVMSWLQITYYTSTGVTALTLKNFQSTDPDCPRRLRSSSPSSWLIIHCLCHHVSIRTKRCVFLLNLHLCTVCCNHGLICSPWINIILFEINSTCMYLASRPSASH